MTSRMACRCCLLRPPDKDLKIKYQRLDKTEVYADMLRDCFKIQLTLGASPGDSGICEVCVGRLRDASDFKHQVQRCQEHLHTVKEELMPKVKEELMADLDDDIYFQEVKAEVSDYSEEDDKKLCEILGFGLRGLTVKRTDKKRVKKRSDKDRKTSKNAPLKISLNNINKVPKAKFSSLEFSQLSENKKYQTNVRNLIKYSNCTPFSNKTIAGITCVYCRNTYQDLVELKEHIRNTHKDDDFQDKRKHKSNLSIKMDITDLKCNICNESFSLITDLKQHLSKQHEIKFYPDVKDYILEFKLTENEILNCALCHSTFETFKMLLQHMNGHYRNYICDVCDLGFINKHKLKNHQRIHEIGDFNCSFCDKVFTTRVKKLCHEKYTHNTNARYTTNCPHCDQSFTSYYQRNRHMFTEHNVSAASYKCNICDKSFILKSKLTSHIKKVHLMERNHICPECGQGFFIKQSLDEHMVKHNGERVFKCTFCNKAYARKKTLREHLRIHNNDRRFKCGVCALAFVQKCSLKSHMLSNHGITLAEYENAKEMTESPTS